MRVAGVSGGGGVVRSAGARAALAGGAAFQVDAASGPPAAAPTPTGGVDSLGALLALQAIGDRGQSRRRQAARAGHDVLDGLQSLRLSILDGSLSSTGADALEGMLGRLSASGEGELDEALAAINLRARVELAKLGRFPG